MTAVIDIGGTPSSPPSGWNPGATTSAVPQERTPWMRETNGRRRITLSSLRDGMPGLTPAWGGVMAEAASVCLESQGHGLWVDLKVEGEFREEFIVERLGISVQMRNAHRNEEKTTEHGAYGIALLTLVQLTGQTVLSQSWKWTGFDYTFGSEQEEDLFQEATRLEISGIRQGTERAIRTRVQEKLTQMRSRRSSGLARSLVAIVEFSRPYVRIEEP